jgi:glycosyltransferase involved in cell wall biosynthesis
MSDPLVSVVIATYDMGPFVGKAIESVLAQTYGHLELVVVDDGSRDDTRAVVGRYLGDPRVRYYWQKNAGQTVAKNTGIRLSSGKYVGFCDADDEWLPNKLGLQVPVLESLKSVGLVYTRVQRMGDADETLPRSGPSGHVTADLFVYNFVPFGTALVRRACLEKVGVFDERYRMGIDWELWLRMSVLYEFAFVEEVTYRYRVWEGQMSTNWRGRYEHCFRIMKDFQTRFPAAVSQRTVTEAWAHSYASRARIRSYQDRQHLAAVTDVMRALAYRPFYKPAWRAFGRVAANIMGFVAP